MAISQRLNFTQKKYDMQQRRMLNLGEMGNSLDTIVSDSKTTSRKVLAATGDVHSIESYYSSSDCNPRTMR